MDKVEHSWKWRSRRDDRNKFRSTFRWKRAPRTTRQTRTGVNVSENRYKFSISIISVYALPETGALCDAAGPDRGLRI